MLRIFHSSSSQSGYGSKLKTLFTLQQSSQTRIKSKQPTQITHFWSFWGIFTYHQYHFSVVLWAQRWISPRNPWPRSLIDFLPRFASCWADWAVPQILNVNNQWYCHSYEGFHRAPGYPQIIHFNRMFHEININKPSILGAPHLRETPIWHLPIPAMFYLDNMIPKPFSLIELMWNPRQTTTHKTAGGRPCLVALQTQLCNISISAHVFLQFPIWLMCSVLSIFLMYIIYICIIMYNILYIHCLLIHIIYMYQQI